MGSPWLWATGRTRRLFGFCSPLIPYNVHDMFPNCSQFVLHMVFNIYSTCFFYVVPNVPKGPSHVFVEFIPHDFAQCSLNCSHNFNESCLPLAYLNNFKFNFTEVICKDNKTQSQMLGFLEIEEANQSARWDCSKWKYQTRTFNCFFKFPLNPEWFEFFPIFYVFLTSMWLCRGLLIL